MDIHNYKGRFERTLENIKKDREISKRNKELILKFKDMCLCQNISFGKIDAYLFYLVKYVKWLKNPLERATKEDIMKFIAELNQTKYTEQTKVCLKIVVKKIYKMIEETEEYPDKVKWISTRISENHKKLPEELLTENEIEAIIRNAKTIRDKALLAVLAESGARISEIGTMKIKHISFEEYGARLSITGKTGPRKILIINSAPYLQEWLNNHPENDNPESYLWYNQNEASPCLSYTRIVSILKTSVKRAGIKKRVYCHLLRHSQATKMANIMSESAMKMYFGWLQSSKMAGVYVHMSGKDTDNAILKANGIEIKKEKEKLLLEPKKCLKCKTINEATNRFCKICGLPLSKEEANNILKADTERQQADEIMNGLIKDPEILELIKKKLSS